MNLLAVLDALLVAAVAVAGFWLRKLEKSVDAYASEKGKNLATREDIAGITHKIESVKVELVLNTEVRKQVAVEKVKALKRLAEAARRVGEDVYCVLQPDSSKRRAAVDAYWSAYREGLILLDAATCSHAEAFGTEAAGALGAPWSKAIAPGPGVGGHDHDAAVAHDPGLASELKKVTTRGYEARDRLFLAIRRELQLAPDRAECAT